jgi:hypothetical protein
MNPYPLQVIMSLVIWLCIPLPGKPYWVLEYSALPCNFCSDNPPDDSAPPVPWPYPLPDGWSVEWDPSPANANPFEWCHARASMTSALSTCTMPYFNFRCLNKNLCPFCNNSPGWECYVIFKYSCVISACDVKCDGLYISGHAFVRGTLFDPEFGGLSGRYPTGQAIIPFEVCWSPLEWTCVLEPV